MKTKLYVLAIICLGLITVTAVAQNKPYTVTSGEIIFSNSQASFNQEFINKYPGANLASNNVRFTCFFHLGQYVHYDFSNNFGIFSGLAIRNVGMITDETLPQQVDMPDSKAAISYEEFKIIRRQYTLGIPLALKIGAFDKHIYFFGGGEYEMAFHFKEKYWTGNFDRDGSKTKDTEWFSSQTPTFLPSVFGGIQFPYGLNVKFKYYLTDFLNHDFKGNGNAVGGSPYDVSDQSRYEASNMFYFSICWQFNNAEMMNYK